MRELDKFVHFIEGRRDLYKQMTNKPEMMPVRLIRSLSFNERYEREASLLVDQKQMSTAEAGRLYLALSEFFKFGHSPYFPGNRSMNDMYQAAYWLLHAFAYNDRFAFLFLHSMVPECFIENTKHNDMINAIKLVLTQLDQLSTPDECVKKRRKNEAMARFLTNMIIQPEIDIDEAFAQTSALIIASDKEVEPYQVSYPKAN